MIFRFSYIILFINLQLCAFSDGDRNDPMHPCFLLTLISKMELGENIIFTKFGDGEYECMSREKGYNCDQDAYHPWLAAELRKSLISLSKKNNSYIARWWTKDVFEYFDALARENKVVVPWAWYHLVLNGDEFLEYDYMYQFVKFIISTERKKILFCNQENSRLKDFFRADVCVEIPAQNWSMEYGKWKGKLEEHLEENALVLISGGMCSKVLIDDITNQYKISCIDLGSSFDFLARKKRSRAHMHTYEQEVEYYKEFFPEGWER